MSLSNQTRFVIWFLLATALLGSTLSAQSSSPIDPLRVQFDKAIKAFDRGLQLRSTQPQFAAELFRTAAQALQEIADSGIVNGRLEYNLGNAYLLADDAGRAILHYRRAQRLIPRDPLLMDNLAVARKRCLTTIEPARRRDVLRNVFFWHYDTSSTGRACAALVLYLAVWVLLTVRSFVPRRALGVAAAGCAFLTLVLAASLAAQNWTDRNAPSGVVTAMDVVVHKGPGTTYQRQFAQPLQPGVEFTRREQRAGWWNVELPDGQSGWIEANHAELIPPS